MDLIKKLGGYEKARAMRDSNIDSFDGDASGVRIHYMGDCFYQEDLDLSLLKYRRANNIFEAGDWIIIDSYKPEFQFYQLTADDMGSHWINLVEFRHATDEEIAAGHRL